MMKLARSTLRYRAGVRSDARTLIVKRVRLSRRPIRATATGESRRCSGARVACRQASDQAAAPSGGVASAAVQEGRPARDFDGWPTKADHRGHVWTWDFIADSTVRGGALRMLTVLDEHTRRCHVLRRGTDVQGSRRREVRTGEGRRRKARGARFIRSDNGRSSSPKSCKRGLPKRKSKRSTSSQEARGRTGSSSRSTDASGMNV